MKTQGHQDIVMQVMICAYGIDGIKRVAKGMHPTTEGVEYLVSWQNDGCCQIPVELDRADFKIISTQTKGLSLNRNIALAHATAPILLVGDDDADYTEDGLKSVINAFRSHLEADIIAFRFDSISTHKTYPKTQVALDSPPKGYYISSIELAMKRDSVKGKIWFNENFGIGAMFPSGEEEIFVKDCLNASLKGIFIPETIVRHDATTTCSRNLKDASRPLTKGAVFLHLHPFSWPLRMIIHTVRELPAWKEGAVPNPFSYLLNWIKGAVMAKRRHVFPTADFKTTHPSHE